MDIVTTLWVACPYCGERIDLLCDCSVVDQQYIEDCSVCCQPIHVELSVDDQGIPAVVVRQEND